MAASSEQKITVGKVYDMFQQLTKYWTARMIAIGGVIASGSIIGTSMKDMDNNYTVAAERADELKKVRDYMTKRPDVIKKLTDSAENPVSGPLRTFFVAEAARALTNCVYTREKVNCGKAARDSARKELYKAADLVEAQKHAGLIVDYEDLERKLEELNRDIDTLGAALKWYDIAYSSCEAGKMLV